MNLYYGKRNELVLCLLFPLLILGFILGLSCRADAEEIQKTSTEKKLDEAKVESELNNLLKAKYENDSDSIFQGVVSVQNRTRKKAGRILVSSYYAVDFSDTPYTMWAPNLSLGYAIGEFAEVYVNYATNFSNSERYLAKKFKQFTLDGGGTASIDIQKAKSQTGLELNWAPIYGKDSWGPYTVIRSDTFLTLAMYSVKFEKGSGNRLKFGIGKTFFINTYFNVRLAASLSSVEYLSSTAAKDSSMVGYGDMGFVFYL
jgi:hypothetical protein